MPLDAITMTALADELRERLVGGKVDKIYQPTRDEVVLHMRAGGENVMLLLSANPSHPRAHLTDLRIRTMLDENYEDAVLEAELRAEAPAGTRAALTLRDGGKVIAGCEAEISGGRLSAAMPVRNPEKWSAEIPKLYELEIRLTEADGTPGELVFQIELPNIIGKLVGF